MVIREGTVDFSRMYRIDSITAAAFDNSSGSTVATFTGLEQVDPSVVDYDAQVNDVNSNGVFNPQDVLYTVFPGETT